MNPRLTDGVCPCSCTEGFFSIGSRFNVMCRIKKCAWSIISHEARLVPSTTMISFKGRHNVYAVAEMVV